MEQSTPSSATMEKRYQVFVSSTFRDLIEERRQIMHALLEMECFPAGMELFPASDEGAWDLIRRVIDQSDYYVLVIGGRYGSTDSTGISFTEREYDYALNSRKRILPFLHEFPDRIPAGKSEMDSNARRKLEAFRAKVELAHTCKYWNTADDLGGKLSRGLLQTIKHFPSVGWVRTSSNGPGTTLASTTIEEPIATHLKPTTVSTPQNDVSQLAGIQYVGEPGISQSCKEGVMRFIQFGDRITKARILTCAGSHGLLIEVEREGTVAIKSGFSSGYGGEGPTAFSYVLSLLDRLDVDIEEYEVDLALFERLENSALTQADLGRLDTKHEVRPIRWNDYIQDRHEAGMPLAQFPPIVPFGIIDERIMDLATSFWDGPDEKLLMGYRRLEDLLRKRSGLRDHGLDLLTHVFSGKPPKLQWPGISDSEHAGRAQLFFAAFQAFRDPRTHYETRHNEVGSLAEFLLLNHLHLLEKQAVALRDAK